MVLYEKACSGGEAKGCVNLGSIYLNGEGVAKSVNRAIAFYKRACDKGHEGACGWLQKAGKGFVEPDSLADERTASDAERPSAGLIGSISGTDVPRVRRGAMPRIIDGETWIVVLDRRKKHRLNEVGMLIWQLCDGRNVNAIVDSVVDEYEVDRSTAMRDAKKFLSELHEVGALELESGH